MVNPTPEAIAKAVEAMEVALDCVVLASANKKIASNTGARLLTRGVRKKLESALSALTGDTQETSDDRADPDRHPDQ